MRTWSPLDNVGLARMALARTYGVALRRVKNACAYSTIGQTNHTLL